MVRLSRPDGVDRAGDGVPSEPGAARTGGRRLILFSGAAAAVVNQMARALTRHRAADVMWVGTAAPAPWRAIAAREVNRHLGTECRLLVFNAFDGFDPNAFAAAVGTLRGGGDCVVLTPPLETWPNAEDPYRERLATYPLRPGELRPGYLQRLVSMWSSHRQVACWTGIHDGALRLAPAGVEGPLTLTRDQQLVVEQVVRVARGHARRPLLLSADRGRGKSTVLGVAAAQLLCGGWPRITVIGPHRRAVATLFRHACEQAGVAFAPGVGDRLLGGGELRFRLPQECLAPDAEAPGLILVDEAASMPVAILDALLRVSNRLVFATTEHGYEGSGRGFRLRFEQRLRRAMPQFRLAHLDAPVRWSKDDPLEQLVNRGLLLDAEAQAPPRAAGVEITLLEADRLGGDEQRLEAIFGLLTLAHYQTRPSDLRALLDNPQLRLWVAQANGRIAGVLLGSLEGGFEPAVCAEVLAGRRRPRGHLLAQSLAVHAGLDQALRLRTLRVQRIAVHPERHRQGVGRRLVACAADWGRDHGVDMLGCAFGIDSALLAFWESQGLAAARLGVRIDPCSAAHTLFMLCGLSGAGQVLSATARQQFRRDLPWALGDVLSDLPAELAVRLVRGRACADLVLNEADELALARIAAGARQAETASAVLWRWLVGLAASGCTDRALAPLFAWRVQRWPIERVCGLYRLDGAAALHDHLRRQLAASPPVPAAQLT